MADYSFWAHAVGFLDIFLDIIALGEITLEAVADVRLSVIRKSRKNTVNSILF